MHAKEEADMSGQSTLEKLAMTWPLAAPDAVRGPVQRLIKETQKAMAAWMARRQEAAEAGIQAFQALCTSKDPGAFAKAYREWMTSRMNRLAEEMSAAQEQALRCAEIRREFATAAFRSTMEPAKAAAQTRAEAGNDAPPARAAAE
jgi:hypothetical protein